MQADCLSFIIRRIYSLTNIWRQPTHDEQVLHDWAFCMGTFFFNNSRTTDQRHSFPCSRKVVGQLTDWWWGFTVSKMDMHSLWSRLGWGAWTSWGSWGCSGTCVHPCQWSSAASGCPGLWAPYHQRDDQFYPQRGERWWVRQKEGDGGWQRKSTCQYWKSFFVFARKVSHFGFTIERGGSLRKSDAQLIFSN